MGAVQPGLVAALVPGAFEGPVATFRAPAQQSGRNQERTYPDADEGENQHKGHSIRGCPGFRHTQLLT